MEAGLFCAHDEGRNIGEKPLPAPAAPASPGLALVASLQGLISQSSNISINQALFPHRFAGRTLTAGASAFLAPANGKRSRQVRRTRDGFDDEALSDFIGIRFPVGLREAAATSVPGLACFARSRPPEDPSSRDALPEKSPRRHRLRSRVTFAVSQTAHRICIEGKVFSRQDRVICGIH